MSGSPVRFFKSIASGCSIASGGPELKNKQVFKYVQNHAKTTRSVIWSRTVVVRRHQLCYGTDFGLFRLSVVLLVPQLPEGFRHFLRGAVNRDRANRGRAVLRQGTPRLLYEGLSSHFPFSVQSCGNR